MQHDVQATLAHDGFEVIRRAVPVALGKRVVDALASRLGIDVDDPATWDRVSREVDQVPLWGDQSQWDIRQLPHLHQRWAEIWGTERLWVCRNSIRFTRPWGPGVPDGQAIHWDVDPLDVTQRWISGVLALTATPPGGFRCVPSLFRDRAAWQHTRATPGPGPDGDWLPDVSGREIVEVHCEVGDLIVFDNRLPHGTLRNTGTTPRIAFYLQYFPTGTVDDAAERVADHLAGIAPRFWRWKPGHDRVEPGPPAVLDALGRKLLGVDDWEHER
jgi:hypothetical protein